MAISITWRSTPPAPCAVTRFATGEITVAILRPTSCADAITPPNTVRRVLSPRCVQLPAGQCSTTSVRGQLGQLHDRYPGRTPGRPLAAVSPEWEYAEMESPFGSPELWRQDDLIGVSRVFNEELAVAAYECGAFPMPAQPGLMGWYSPLQRAIIPLDGLQVSRSLRKSIRRFGIRIDTAFDDVLDGCSDRRRPSGWINPNICRGYWRQKE